ncbi:MAG TPA: hypothetical protein VH914_09875 [Acidimicrobiia bacterium]|jgi:hypothetical protein|nr:hypothetical protein [Acidimicrobiia bacterium]
MKRLFAVVIGVLMLGAPVLAAAPAVAAPTAPTRAATGIAGNYTWWVRWSGHAYHYFATVDLYRNHTGGDNHGDTITWSREGRAISLTFTAIDGTSVTHYTGTKTRKGFSKKLQPGIVTDDEGGSGNWYAFLNGA